MVSVDNEVLIIKNEKMMPGKVINVSSQFIKGDYYSIEFFQHFSEGKITFHAVLEICLKLNPFKFLFQNITGAYVPLTKEGNIMIDGVLTSCYSSFQHDLAHIGMTPVQWFPGVMKWLFGVDGDILAYVSITKELGRFILPQWLI